MQPFHTINVSEMCGEVVLSQGVILLDQSAWVPSWLWAPGKSSGCPTLSPGLVEKVEDEKMG